MLLTVEAYSLRSWVSIETKIMHMDLILLIYFWGFRRTSPPQTEGGSRLIVQSNASLSGVATPPLCPLYCQFLMFISWKKKTYKSFSISGKPTETLEVTISFTTAQKWNSVPEVVKELDSHNVLQKLVHRQTRHHQQWCHYVCPVTSTRRRRGALRPPQLYRPPASLLFCVLSECAAAWFWVFSMHTFFCCCFCCFCLIFMSKLWMENKFG